MYLVSLYFDEKTDHLIHPWKSPKRDTPNHITVASFDADVTDFARFFSFENIRTGEIHFVSLGLLGKDNIVLYVVLNEYLHGISQIVHASLGQIEDAKISQKYRVWGWIPHVTLASKCNDQDVETILLRNRELFHDFTGRVIRISISSTQPYKEIISWDLQEDL